MRTIHVKAVAETDGELRLSNLPIQKGDAVEAIMMMPHGTSVEQRRTPAQDFLEHASSSSFRSSGAIRPVRSCMNAVDTNIWVYCYDHRDPAKQQKAKELVSSLSPWCCYGKLGASFCRGPQIGIVLVHPTTAWEALAKIEAMADFVFFPQREIWTRARRLQEEYSLQFRIRCLSPHVFMKASAGCLSEDFQHGEQIDGVTILNPFLPNAK